MKVNCTASEPCSESHGQASAHHCVNVALLSCKFKGQKGLHLVREAGCRVQHRSLRYEGVDAAGASSTAAGLPSLLPALPQASFIPPAETQLSGHHLRGRLLPFPGLGAQPFLLHEGPRFPVPRKQDLKDRKAHWELGMAD